MNNVAARNAYIQKGIFPNQVQNYNISKNDFGARRGSGR